MFQGNESPVVDLHVVAGQDADVCGHLIAVGQVDHVAWQGAGGRVRGGVLLSWPACLVLPN